MRTLLVVIALAVLTSAPGRSEPDAPDIEARVTHGYAGSGGARIHKRNYPREPYTAIAGPLVKVQAPVLMFHGLDDQALLHAALNGIWEWLERDLTLVTIPGPAISCSRTPPIS